MSKKSESLYEAVLKKIADMMPDFQPKLAVGDYEKAPRNAFRTIFTSIDISGCLFHYSKAIWKKVKKLQLSSSYIKNPELNKWIRFVMTLPMLPKEEIVAAYQLLTDMSLSNLNQIEIGLLRKLKSYIKREWIQRNDFSIYGSIQTTNNCCEVYHKSLKSSIRVKKPNITCKEKYQNKEYAIMEYLNEVSSTIGNPQYHNYSEFSDSDSEDVMTVT